MYISIGELVRALKTEEISQKSHTRLKRIRNANLVITGDLMFMAVDQQKANFSNLIDLYNNASIILTSNKAPKEWDELYWVIQHSPPSFCTE